MVEDKDHLLVMVEDMVAEMSGASMALVVTIRVLMAVEEGAVTAIVVDMMDLPEGDHGNEIAEEEEVVITAIVESVTGRVVAVRIAAITVEDAIEE